MNKEVRRFSLRKLSVGLASVLVGISIFGASQTVRADTVANSQTSSMTNNAQNSDTQENGNVAELSSSNDNQVDNAENNATQTQEVNNSKNLGAEDTFESGQKAQSFNLPKNSPKLAKKVLATNLIETNSLPTTNGGFDEATWGKLDVTRWQGSVQDGVYQLTNYTGDLSHIIVPNEADFEQAGKSTNGLQVGITRDTAYSLSSNGAQTIAFSKTNSQKVKAIGTDWSGAFAGEDLSEFDGSNLDVSNVTDMSEMFENNKVSDLKPLANWNVSNVTDMSEMFMNTSISDLTSLAHWDTSKVTDMSIMFTGDSISDLTPLANWNVSNVISMTRMFMGTSISDLTPLAHWNVSNVTDMSEMFENNKVSDLKPLANWNVSNVTNMGWMFETNKISDLTPLSNWDTSKVTDMTYMFHSNPNIIDLKPIANWNISGFGLFYSNTKLNLTNINNTPLMQGFLKEPDALGGATFITNNADLVKATTGKDLPNLTNTAKRTITFNLPHAEPKTITQIINYKTIAPVQIEFNPDIDGGEIVQTYPVKESEWQLDGSKKNDDVIIDGAICFKPVQIPHVNGYKAHLVRNKLNPASFMVSFFAIPPETKPSKPIEETPLKPSAPADNTNKSVDDLQKRIATKLNSHYSDWTMPADVSKSTYTVEMPVDNTIDLSDLMIAQPVHAQTRTQIRVTKHVKLRKHGKKHVVKHFKHRRKMARTFKKYRL